MREKKAWLKIVEAFISVMLIASTLLILYSRTAESKTGMDYIYIIEKGILQEVASDNNLREKILGIPTTDPTTNCVIDANAENDISAFALTRIPENFEVEIKICEVGVICSLSSFKENVYSSERIVSATLECNNPRIVKIFMWRK